MKKGITAVSSGTKKRKREGGVKENWKVIVTCAHVFYSQVLHYRMKVQTS
jgi:hypothetical protein